MRFSDGDDKNGIEVKIKLIEHALYVWEDKVYRDFMFNILSNLEPISFKKNEILFDELDEFNSVIFIMKCKYKIGYSINKTQYFRLQL